MWTVIFNRRMVNIWRENDKIDSDAFSGKLENGLQHQETEDRIELSADSINSTDDSDLISDFDSTFGSLPVIDTNGKGPDRTL